MIENHVPVPLNDFNGLFDRGPNEAVPVDHFKVAQNIKYKPQSFYTREGFVTDITIGPIIRFHIYKITGQATRLLVLGGDATIYDIASGGTSGTPILTIPGMTDFSMETFFDRAYITPHNGITGLPGQFVYYYTGSGVARPAGGAGPPAAVPMGIAQGGAGRIDKGVHAFAVAFETATGFITQFGGFTGIVTDGDKTVELSAIPVGPAGTVARVIFSTKNVADPATGLYNWDYMNAEWFFAVDGRIPDNTTTTKSLSYFDADLVDQADYILEQLPTIPAGVGITAYQGSMVVWGEDANQSTVRVSKAGEPESFNAVEGFLQVEPAVGGGVRNCVEFRSSLYILKAHRCYVTQAQDQEAIFWKVPLLDGSVGTECHGVAKIFERNSNTVDKYLVASRRGLMMFTGNFDEEISWKIKDIWERITRIHFQKIQVSIDPDQQYIYISLPLDGSTWTNTLLFGDYSNGLNAKNIKWSLWTFQTPPTSIGVEVDNVSKENIFRVALLAGDIKKQLPTARDDSGVAIPTIFETAELPVDSKGEVFHHGGVRFRALGVGRLNLTITTLDGGQVMNLPAISLRAGPGFYPMRTFNAQSEKITIKGSLALNGEYIIVTKMWAFVRQLWLTRPSE
jgi:hypothetical protein